MRKFLFEGFWNDVASDELAFDFMGHVGSGREKSATVEPFGPVLPIFAVTCALGASSASDCVLLSVISTPVT
jgi:hypothetical protein